MSTKLPTSMRALTIAGNKATLSSIPLPSLRPSYVLIKVHSVALNPTDWKHISRSIAAPNGVSGCDFSGAVVSIGSAVTKSNLAVGDRVAGVTHGANFSQPQDGCFAEYAVAKGDLLFKLPSESNIDFDAAATFPLGIYTVGQGLFQKGLKIPLSRLAAKSSESGEAKPTVLIYAGSTATGALGIQLAKAAGYKVITTCSPHNEAYVKSLGADEVFDYRDPKCGEKINAATGNELKLAWDTISLPASAEICAKALSSEGAGARYGTILPVELPRKDVESAATLMYTIFGEAYEKPKGKETAAQKEDFEFAKELGAIVEGLLAEGKLKTHELKVGEKGLVGVLEGLKDLKADRVSGKKLVYRVGETPEGAEAEAEF